MRRELDARFLVIMWGGVSRSPRPGGIRPDSPDRPRAEFGDAMPGRSRVPVPVMMEVRRPAGLRALTKQLAKLLRQASEVGIPDASRVMHVANPDATGSAIIRFLDG